MADGIKSYRDLIIWQKGIDIVDAVYIATNRFPKEELFSLVSQVRRSAVSIPSNIAEGWGREYDKSFLNFFRIARGSLYELETQIAIARRRSYIGNEEFEIINGLLIEESKMLASFMKKISIKIG